MIISEFYDDEQTITYGNDSAILTKNIIDLGVNTSDIDKAYLMGYVDPDYVPQITHLSKINVVSGGGADYVEFVDVTKKENIPWMYTSGANGNGSSTTASKSKKVCYHLNNTDGWVFVDSANSFMKFINSLKVSNASQRVINVCFIAYTIDTVETTKDNYWTGGSTELTFTNSQEFLDWLHGDITKTILLQLSSTNPSNYRVDFEISGTNFESGEYEIDTDYDGATGRFKTFIYINGIYFASQRGIGQNGNLGGYPETAVTYHLKSDDGYDWLYRVDGLVGARFASVTSGDPYYLQYSVANLLDENYVSSQGFNVNGNRYIFGGMTGKIPYRWLVEARPGQVIKHERTLFRKYSYSPTPANNSIRIHIFFLKSDIERMVQQWIRIQLGGSASYGFSDNVGVPKYNTDNSPAWQILTGDFEEIEDDLRPWQIDDIKYNPFTIDDVPPYVPPGPTPGGDDNSETGDKIPNQFGRNVGVTSNFITQYLMTQGQISKLGEVLWTSWADDTVTMEMVENFYGKLHDATGSWNVSSALQFLVSCRMFPVSLATLVGTTATSSIPIGTGAFALQCGTSTEPTFFIANESVAVLNCGDVYVPKEFGDYRDFDNTNITAYLPYCGSVQLSPQDVVGKWLGCTYAIDLFDGSCKAFLYTLSGDDVGYEGAYYNVAVKEGQCGFLIPMSATQAGEVASRRKVDSYVDGSMLFNAGSTMLDGTMRIASGDGLGAIGADVGRLANLGFTYNTLSAQRMGRSGIAAPSIAGGSGFADFMQPASPYIQIRRSRYQMPIQYENSAAYPTNAESFGNLSQFTGFVQCKNVDVHGFTCHEEERSAIKALLESGVYL